MGEQFGRGLLRAHVTGGVLDLKDGKLGGERAVTARVVVAAVKSSLLTKLDTRGNDISEEAAQQLAAAVLGSKTLEVFSEIPIKEIRKHKQTVDFSRQRLGPTEAIVLAALNQGSAVLNKLVLSHVKIKDEGAIALGEALKSNKTLNELVLYNCNIGAEGGKALASALGTAVLTKLDARLTSLGDEGKKVLRDAAEGREGFQLLLRS